MIIKLNVDGSIKVLPQLVPEHLSEIYIEYIYPENIGYLKPVLRWGAGIYEGDNIYIKKTDLNFEMTVDLMFKDKIINTYTHVGEPEIFISYGLTTVAPNIIEYVKELEKENRELKERGDLI